MLHTHPRFPAPGEQARGSLPPPLLQAATLAVAGLMMARDPIVCQPRHPLPLRHSPRTTQTNPFQGRNCLVLGSCSLVTVGCLFFARPKGRARDTPMAPGVPAASQQFTRCHAWGSPGGARGPGWARWALTAGPGGAVGAPHSAGETREGLGGSCWDSQAREGTPRPWLCCQAGIIPLPLTRAAATAGVKVGVGEVSVHFAMPWAGWGASGCSFCSWPLAPRRQPGRTARPQLCCPSWSCLQERPRAALAGLPPCHPPAWGQLLNLGAKLGTRSAGSGCTYPAPARV